MANIIFPARSPIIRSKYFFAKSIEWSDATKVFWYWLVVLQSNSTTAFARGGSKEETGSSARIT